MYPSMRACFSYGWDATEAYHRCMLSVNESLNRLQLRMEEPQAPYELLFTQEF